MVQLRDANRQHTPNIRISVQPIRKGGQARIRFDYQYGKAYMDFGRTKLS